MSSLILQYSYLQVLDLLTTVAFLINGVKKANPLVKGMMHVTSSSGGAGLLPRYPRPATNFRSTEYLSLNPAVGAAQIG